MALISVDDHVQEPPDVWTRRLARDRWGDHVPHIERLADGTDRWVSGDRPLDGSHVARAGAFMADRSQEPRCWEDVPAAAYVPAERLKAMDAAGIDYSVLYPTIAGVAGQTFGQLQ